MLMETFLEKIAELPAMSEETFLEKISKPMSELGLTLKKREGNVFELQEKKRR
jgi:hypothetical protein